MFYVDNGIMVYVVSKGPEFTDKNGYSNAELHIIYENGTENKKALLRSFVSNLHDSTRYGRMVTEVIDDVMTGTSIEDRVTTGYIYVAKSLSPHPQIASLNNLYKIGFTEKSVEKRLENAESEGTYLYAPVHLVMSFEVKNFSARKLETTLHHYFANRQLDIELLAPSGQSFIPKEWFLVSLEEIKEVIQKIIMELSVR
ncbi:YeeC-like protein [Streptococcus sp. DD11]|nr:YeeC-like protein [Streptococcus sp. DD11]